MSKEFIATGKTVDDAIEAGLQELGCERTDVTIEILEQASKGILGFIGHKDAKVKLTVIDEMSEALSFETKVPVKKEKPAVEKKVAEKKPEVKEPEKKTENVQSSEDDEKAKQILGDFVLQLMQKMDIDAKVDVSIADSRITVDISGENMGIIIGRRGETLDAVQHVSQLYINKTCEKFYKVIIDTEDYRAKREEALKNLAQGLAKKVLKTRKEIALEPMKAYERRIIHTALQGYNKIVTHSVGVEPNRRLVVGYKYTPRVNKDEKQEIALENTEE